MATPDRPLRNVLLHLANAGWIGFLLGLAAAGLYLLLGGGYFLDVPQWARVVFYPGFVVGCSAYGHGASETAAKCVGVMGVGITYALLTVLLRAVVRRTRSRVSARREVRSKQRLPRRGTR